MPAFCSELSTTDSQRPMWYWQLGLSCFGTVCVQYSVESPLWLREADSKSYGEEDATLSIRQDKWFLSGWPAATRGF